MRLFTKWVGLSIGVFITTLTWAQQWVVTTATDGQGIYGIKGIPSAENSPGKRIGAASCTDKNGNLWLYGGGTDGNNLGDLWRFDVSTYQWTWESGSNLPNRAANHGTKGVASTENFPGGRVGHTLWADNDGNLWLYGGSRPLADDFATSMIIGNDLWKYNPTAKTWTWMHGSNQTVQSANKAIYGTLGVPTSQNTPGGRYFGTGFKDKFGHLWLFSGNEGNDLWKYDVQANVWLWIKGNNTPKTAGSYGQKGVESPLNLPDSRTRTTGFTDANGDFWIFGGQHYNDDDDSFYLNDLWKYNFATNRWVWMSGTQSYNHKGSYGTLRVPSVNNIPRARESAAGWVNKDGYLVVFGGGTEQGNLLNDTWYYNPKTQEWSWRSGSNEVNSDGEISRTDPDEDNAPSARSIAAVWEDSLGSLWMFGGLGIKRQYTFEGYTPIKHLVMSHLNDMNKIWVPSVDLKAAVKTEAVTYGEQNLQLLTITVSEQSNYGATRIKVRTPLPKGMKFYRRKSSSVVLGDLTVSNDTLDWYIPYVVPKTSATLQFYAQLDAAQQPDGKFQVCSSIYYQYAQESNDADNQACITVESSTKVISRGTSWAYLDNGTLLNGTDWQTNTYNDATWKTGSAPLGFDRNNRWANVDYKPVTLLSQGPTSAQHKQYYFRKQFASGKTTANFRLKLWFDDGIAVFVNGKPVYQKNATDTDGDGYVNYPNGSEVLTDTLLRLNNLSTTQANQVAVVVYQNSPTSSDLLFDFQLETIPLGLTRQPYLQLPGPNTMTIRWYTTEAINGIVRYGTDPANLNLTAQDYTLDTVQIVKLEGLASGTKYYYSVGYGDPENPVVLQSNPEINQFQTLSSTSTTLRYWLLGDAGAGKAQNQRPYRVRDAYLNYLKSKGNPNIDGILFLGDNSNTQPFEGLQQALDTTFFRFYNRPADKPLLSKTPFWTVLGNHDYDPDNAFVLNDKIVKIQKAYHKQTAASYSAFSYPRPTLGVEKGYYSFNQGDVHFVVLNPYLIEGHSLWVDPNEQAEYKQIWGDLSIVRDQNEGDVNQIPQIQWLKNDLANNTKRWTVVTFHIPPFSTIGHFEDEADLKRVRERLLPILEEPAYHVDAIVVSHTHAYLRAGMVRKSGTTRKTDFSLNGNLGRTTPYVKTSAETAYSYILTGSAGRGFYSPTLNDGGYNPTDANVVKSPSTSMLPLDVLASSNDFYHVTGGSVELLFNDNRLDVKFIKEPEGSNTFVVADSFSIIKDPSVKRLMPFTSTWFSHVELHSCVSGSGGPYYAPEWSNFTAWSKDTVWNPQRDNDWYGQAPFVDYTAWNTNGLKDGTLIRDLEIGGNAYFKKIFILSQKNNFTGFQLQISRFQDVAVGIYINGMKVDTLLAQSGPIFTKNILSIPTQFFKEGVNIIALKTRPLWSCGGGRNYTPYLLDAELSGLTGATPAPASKAVMEVQTNKLAYPTLCSGNSYNIPFSVKNNAPNTVYEAYLSALSPSFYPKRTVIGTGQTSPMKITLPDSLLHGDYQIAVVPAQTSIFEAKQAAFYTIQLAPKVTFSTQDNRQSAEIWKGESIPMQLKFTGIPPWSFTLSNGLTDQTAQNTYLFRTTPDSSLTYTVTMKNSCGLGRVEGQVRAVVKKATVQITSLNKTNYCPADSITIGFKADIPTAPTYKFTAYLSDKNGLFNRPITLGTNSVTNPVFPFNEVIKAKLPDTLSMGAAYQIRVSTSTTLPTEEVVSVPFGMRILPSGTLVEAQKKDSLSILTGEPITLQMDFKGSFPWNYVIGYGSSDTLSGSTTRTPLLRSVQPKGSDVYTLRSVSNACGEGKASGRVTVTLITAVDNWGVAQLRVYPNPTTDYLHIVISEIISSEIQWQVVDNTGRILLKKEAKNLSSYDETINTTTWPAGTYFLNLKMGNRKATFKISKQ
ncbi:T9SS type A sorting domain-containing protein [Runella sp. CRIBMP]|uniref:kelch repeat-containing protein n=1 Tax=Runella sp. CRIBMP TaxID=2683261 RepID=UPI0014134F45|nr:kelch repeat-containing protein [Runella sp. CRIBMP]NBB20016.1 T9SS type A sorting domain-containing protein [Runella sp. CRIBMP]